MSHAASYVLTNINPPIKYAYDSNKTECFFYIWLSQTAAILVSSWFVIHFGPVFRFTRNCSSRPCRSGCCHQCFLSCFCRPRYTSHLIRKRSVRYTHDSRYFWRCLAFRGKKLVFLYHRGQKQEQFHSS